MHRRATPRHTRRLTRATPSCSHQCNAAQQAQGTPTRNQAPATVPLGRLTPHRGETPQIVKASDTDSAFVTHQGQGHKILGVLILSYIHHRTLRNSDFVIMCKLSSCFQRSRCQWVRRAELGVRRSVREPWAFRGGSEGAVQRLNSSSIGQDRGAKLLPRLQMSPQRSCLDRVPWLLRIGRAD